MTLRRRSPREAPVVASSAVAKAASGKEITAPMRAPRNDIWKVSRTPLAVVASVLAERSGGNIPETNLSMGPVLETSSTRSNPTPAALQPVTPMMTKTTRAGFQENRGTTPPICGCSVRGDAISTLRKRYWFFGAPVALGLGACYLPVRVVARVDL